ncbi:hypothetical protein EXIGLDRAFT_704207 [Exidia glandulosa HHB12029]|uniref:Uncharacterized protein n=1 Tax=Exidia glandulosa HHB12029 TaxID=1314781 RepID=A0A165BSC3_EXIGL|nr:hypothetical protein EXIGLDRAFT_704207 [Exidia glandulosa HHB12029]
MAKMSDILLCEFWSYHCGLSQVFEGVSNVHNHVLDTADVLESVRHLAEHNDTHMLTANATLAANETSINLLCTTANITHEALVQIIGRLEKLEGVLRNVKTNFSGITNGLRAPLRRLLEPVRQPAGPCLGSRLRPACQWHAEHGSALEIGYRTCPPKALHFDADTLNTELRAQGGFCSKRGNGGGQWGERPPAFCGGPPEQRIILISVRLQTSERPLRIRGRTPVAEQALTPSLPASASSSMSSNSPVHRPHAILDPMPYSTQKHLAKSKAQSAIAAVYHPVHAAATDEDELVD